MGAVALLVAEDEVVLWSSVDERAGPGSACESARDKVCVVD